MHEIVTQARKMGILCQGRGSAANSAVCYCLGITSVDPDKNDVLFERFLSNERDEPPDIDVDFEHERREEIIQWIYQEKGRTRAALAATVIAYAAAAPSARSARRSACRPTRWAPWPTPCGACGRSGVDLKAMCARPASIPPIRA